VGTERKVRWRKAAGSEEGGRGKRGSGGGEKGEVGGKRIRRPGREAEWVGGWDRKKAAGTGEGDGAGPG
jgi:hypothetical protein